MATAELFGDEGVVTPDGWHSLELIGIPVVSRNGEEYFNRFPLTRWAEDKAAHVAETERAHPSSRRVCHGLHRKRLGRTRRQEFFYVSAASARTWRGLRSHRWPRSTAWTAWRSAASAILWKTATCPAGISPLPSNRPRNSLVRFIRRALPAACSPVCST